MKVSIIVPIYNVEKYLKECLESLLNQTYTNLEIICINDASTDSSEDIVDSFRMNDSRIILLNHTENEGLAATRNDGISMASGDFILFVDSDDFIEQDTVESLIDAYNESNADCIIYGIKPFANSKKHMNLEDMQEYCNLKFQGFQMFSLDKALNTNIHACGKLFKADIIKRMNLQFIDGYLYEDIYFTWKYLFYNRKMFYLDKELYNYRLRDNSIMQDSEKNKTMQKSIFHLLNWHKLAFEIAEDRQMLLENFDCLMLLLKTLWKTTLKLSKTKEHFIITEIYNTYKTSLQTIYNIEYDRRVNDIK